MTLVIVIITVFFIVVSLIIVAISQASFFKSTNRKGFLFISISILMLLCGFIWRTIHLNSIPNELFLEENIVSFTNNYGIKISYHDIKNIQQTNVLPSISSRIEGFSLANIKKGLYETESGEKVYLLLNGDFKPYLKITKKNNQVIYYNNADANSKTLYNQLQNIFSYQK